MLCIKKILCIKKCWVHSMKIVEKGECIELP